MDVLSHCGAADAAAAVAAAATWGRRVPPHEAGRGRQPPLPGRPSSSTCVDDALAAAVLTAVAAAFYARVVSVVLYTAVAAPVFSPLRHVSSQATLRQFGVGLSRTHTSQLKA